MPFLIKFSGHKLHNWQYLFNLIFAVVTLTRWKFRVFELNVLVCHIFTFYRNLLIIFLSNRRFKYDNVVPCCEWIKDKCCSLVYQFELFSPYWIWCGSVLFQYEKFCFAWSSRDQVRPHRATGIPWVLPSVIIVHLPVRVLNYLNLDVMIECLPNSKNKICNIKCRLIKNSLTKNECQRSFKAFNQISFAFSVCIGDFSLFIYFDTTVRMLKSLKEYSHLTAWHSKPTKKSSRNRLCIQLVLFKIKPGIFLSFLLASPCQPHRSHGIRNATYNTIITSINEITIELNMKTSNMIILLFSSK